jgi:hypothetical protein
MRKKREIQERADLPDDGSALGDRQRAEIASMEHDHEQPHRVLVRFPVAIDLTGL